jgi:hypothetical protein
VNQAEIGKFTEGVGQAKDDPSPTWANPSRSAKSSPASNGISTRECGLSPDAGGVKRNRRGRRGRGGEGEEGQVPAAAALETIVSRSRAMLSFGDAI